ncbi:hypothetical protein [Epilithonimonas sp.]|uniref:hypothetical protein n=1 Tax=Epilithonimonas sp. TaxID=2894511 RepID=UPI0035B4305A
MKYLVIILVFLISCGKKAEKQTLENFDLEKLDVYNNDQINTFINSFLSNYQPDKEGNLSDVLVRSKFIGNKLRKDSLTLNRIKSDSLISEEDLKFIAKQINDKKEYYVDGKYFKQKIFSSDSLKNENLKFYERESKIIDSLFKINADLAREYDTKSRFEYSKKMRKISPYFYIDKPIFFKDKKRVIFSYSNECCSETSLYEFKNKKWRRKTVLSSYIT